MAVSGCATVVIADATVTVIATTVNAGAMVVEMAVDVVAPDVKAVAGPEDSWNGLADESPIESLPKCRQS